MSRQIRRHFTNNLVGYVALFFSLSLGTAWALGTDSVKSKHIKDGQVRASDLADDTTPYALAGLDIKNNSMGGDDIIDNDVKGVDVDESSLSAVPAAIQGGVGRYAFEGACDPDVPSGAGTGAWEDCAFVSTPLATPGRVLIIGQVEARPDSGHEWGRGDCRLEVNGQAIESSFTEFEWDEGSIEDGIEHGTLTAISNVLPAGSPVLGIECREWKSLNGSGAFDVRLARVSAVALSNG
ncbi:MAG: hypothetical protein QOI31_1282 [Solirubrobacterales bacterium]|jgi:hypothetical protein|nr:hypothetical protein [Solirubrobacterales bacterium]